VVKKEQKHYLFDWTAVQDPPPRFENLVASHLLKWLHHEQDVQGRDLELRYFRDIDGREVDFVVTEGRALVLAVECKWADCGRSEPPLLQGALCELSGLPRVGDGLERHPVSGANFYIDLFDAAEQPVLPGPIVGFTVSGRKPYTAAPFRVRARIRVAPALRLLEKLV